MTEAEWLSSNDPQKMLEFLRGRASDRKSRLFAIAWSRKEWQLLSDDRSKKAVQIAEQYAEGSATVDVLDSAYDSAYEAAYDLDVPGLEPSHSRALYSAVNAAARKVSLLAFPAFGPESISSQIETVRDLFGNPFRPVAILPAVVSWNDARVARIAQTAYEERSLPEGTLDNDRLAILADALEEAGCTNPDVLNHCRQPGEHVRGCWVIDLILGKE
jgi:hypothetical protein